MPGTNLTSGCFLKILRWVNKIGASHPWLVNGLYGVQLFFAQSQKVHFR